MIAPMFAQLLQRLRQGWSQIAQKIAQGLQSRPVGYLVRCWIRDGSPHGFEAVALVEDRTVPAQIDCASLELRASAIFWHHYRQRPQRYEIIGAVRKVPTHAIRRIVQADGHGTWLDVISARRPANDHDQRPLVGQAILR